MLLDDVLQPAVSLPQLSWLPLDELQPPNPSEAFETRLNCRSWSSSASCSFGPLSFHLPNLFQDLLIFSGRSFNISSLASSALAKASWANKIPTLGRVLPDLPDLSDLVPGLALSGRDSRLELLSAISSRANSAVISGSGWCGAWFEPSASEFSTAATRLSPRLELPPLSFPLPWLFPCWFQLLWFQLFEFQPSPVWFWFWF